MNTVAAIQMCSSTLVEENLKMASMLVAQAAKEGAVLAVLPEMFILVDEDPAAKFKIKETEGSGPIQEALSKMAREHRIWIVGGTIPLCGSLDQKVKAACLVFDEKGKQVGRFDKIHLFDVKLSGTEVYEESATIESGDKLTVMDSPVGKLGLAVCFDLRFPELFTALSHLGVEVIAVPSAFTQTTGLAHWELLCRSRAIDTFSYVIGAAQGGVHASGRKTHGHTLIVDPWGKVMDEVKKPGEGIAFADIDLSKLQSIREVIPCVRSRTTLNFI